MRIAVIGTGFVGVVTAAVFAKFRNLVIGLDVNPDKVEKLRQGEMPFYEPGLQELVRENLRQGNLTFTTSYQEAIPQASVIIVCVGTPSAPNGQADLTYLFSAIRSMAPYLKDRAIIVIKSTVPPSTNTNIEQIIQKESKKQFYTASVPEFLKEGTAVADCLHPQRVIIGAREPFVRKTLLELHRPISGKKLVMSPESAQLTKYAANAYLATRITFINEIANLCEATGADIEEVILGLGADRRIGPHYWYPGPGYGGSCFPKDVRELAAFATSVGLGDSLFATINRLNESRIPKLLRQYEKVVGGFAGKRVAVLGLSFKPQTDDLREAPSTVFIPRLLRKKAKICAFDPKAIEAAKRKFGDRITYAGSVDEAIKDADTLLLLIEWEEFKHLDLSRIKRLMRGNVFIDTRNQYDPRQVTAAGLRYIGIGR